MAQHRLVMAVNRPAASSKGPAATACQALDTAKGARTAPAIPSPNHNTPRLPDTRLAVRFQQACRQAAATIKPKALRLMRINV